MEELGNILKSMGFKEGDMPDTWKGIMEGIHFSICRHPLKGIAVSFYCVGERTGSEGEIFIPDDSNQQRIAQTLVAIHNQVYGQ